MVKIHSASFVVFALLLVLGPAINIHVNGAPIPFDLNTGPYVEQVDFKVIANSGQRMLALQSGAIDLHLGNFDSYNLPVLEEDPNIDVSYYARNGYGTFVFNCAKYPLNISGLRRAFAYAFDKAYIRDAVTAGFSLLHDSLVPYSCGWCIEDDLEWHYYTAEPEIGNEVLDSLGFSLNTETGFRLAPDGSEFSVVYVTHGYTPTGYLVEQAVLDAWSGLHIDARSEYIDFFEMMEILDNHLDYDMYYYARNFPYNDVRWLASDYWSENADVYGQNPTNFRNATYDSWRDLLLNSTSYEAVYEASSQMQRILHENVPALVVYENIYLQAYRTDTYQGHINDLRKGISGSWTLRKIHRIDGAPGGSISVAISEEPDSFNIFVTNSAYSEAIMENLWPSLYSLAPDGTPWPYLASNMLIETHAENTDIPLGHSRFTIDIIQNATWSDGIPLTAQDVIGTLTYQIESEFYGNPAATDLVELESAYSPSTHRLVLEFRTESYWHLYEFALEKIIPIHIFNDIDGIGYDQWNTWNPVFDPAEPHVTAGPFSFTDFEAGTFYQISANPQFAAYIAEPSTSNTATSSGENPSWGLYEFSIFTVISVSMVVIVVFVSRILEHQRGIK